MKPFTQNVIHIIESIPEGKVMTYGQIAKDAGSPRGARQVVRILHSMSQKYELPWHRVVNAKGEIAIKDEDLNQVQIVALKSEGIEVGHQHRVNLKQHQHFPESNDVDLI